MTSVAEEASRIQGMAAAGPVGKRRTSVELYKVLVACAALAERCAEGDDYQELRRIARDQPRHGQNRRYVERRSDEYTLVCRIVFGDLKSRSAERSNASRYAHSLREAKRTGINASLLFQHLRDNGGINGLFLRRPLAATSVTTKTLYLTDSITVPKGVAVHLVLRREADNRFNVLEQKNVGQDYA